MLDQSFGNVVQAFVYLAIMASLQSETTDQAWNTTMNALLPMTKARLRFWPIAALVSFTIVPPNKRVLFNNMVGMTWVSKAHRIFKVSGVNLANGNTGHISKFGSVGQKIFFVE